MNELLLWGASIGLAAATSALAARAATRGPLLARLKMLDDHYAREISSARRREHEGARRSASKVKLLRSALGLPFESDDLALTPRGRALAESVVERLHGLASVDRCIVADAQGLPWTAGDFAEAAALAACAGSAIGATLRGTSSRSLHVELDDARHVVVRLVPGTMPTLALAVLSTSRPASAFALDAVLAHASLLMAADDVDVDLDDPLTGWSSRASRIDAPVTLRLARELEDAAPAVSCGSMALFVGDDMVAAYGTDGPRRDDLPIFAAALREALAQIESRLRCRARRIDWIGRSGAAITLSPLGTSRRTAVLVTRRDGPVDGSAFDRLGGRLRRLLPADPDPTGQVEVRA